MIRKFSLSHLTVTMFLALMFTSAGGFYSVIAQSLPNFRSYDPATPLAFSFAKYGDYPVDYNTGKVDMSVPIYTIESGSLTLPVGMSFHASGRLTNETNGVLGMRWALSTGYQITRTVNGFPDEWDEVPPFIIPYAYQSSVSYTPTQDELFGCNKEGAHNFASYGYDVYWLDFYDSEYDIFNYKLPSGKSGKFILKNEANGQKKIMTMPFDALKIELNKGNFNTDYYTQIKITDTDGTVYNYGSKDYEDYVLIKDDGPISERATLAWYLESIISADKQDAITFTYDGKSIFGVCNYGERQFIFDKIDLFYSIYTQGDYEMYIDYDHLPVPYERWTTYKLPILSSIQFKNGELNFNYDGDASPEWSGYNKKILRDIVLSGDVNRKFKFNQAVGNNEQGIRYLNSLEFISLNEGVERVEKEYSFDYYEPVSSSDVPTLTSPSSQRDWWGYLNTNTDKLLPSQDIVVADALGCSYTCNMTIGNPVVNREPHLTSMCYGMLKSITYPTKGTTEFVYENNYYKDGIEIKKGPGLRISKIINNPNPIPGNQIVKTYKYGVNEDGMGNILDIYKSKKQLVNEFYAVVAWEVGGSFDSQGNPHFYAPEYVQYRIREFGSENVIKPNDFQDSTIYYDVVNEYIDEDDNKNLRTEYTYYPRYYPNNPLVQEFLYSSSGQDNPKIFVDPHNGYSYPPIPDGGKLKSKIAFINKNGTYTRSTKESFTYFWNEFDYAWDMPTSRNIHFFYESTYGQLFNTAQKKLEFEQNFGGNMPIISYGFRKYVSASEQYSIKEVEHYDESGAVTLTTANTSYSEAQFSRVKTEESTNSDGRVNRIEYEYPFEDLTVPINSKMVGLNMVGVPLTKSQYINKNGGYVFLQNSRTEYGEWSPASNSWNIDSNMDVDIIRPRIQYFKKSNSTEEPILEYLSYYNNGKVKEASKTDGTHIVYIWGYDGQYPIAKNTP